MSVDWLVDSYGKMRAATTTAWLPDSRHLLVGHTTTAGEPRIEIVDTYDGATRRLASGFRARPVSGWFAGGPPHQLAADQMQAGIDPRRGSRAGDQVAVVDEEHIRVQGCPGVPAGQFLGPHPVRGAASAVEQAGGAEDERSAAHAQDGGALAGRTPQGREDRVGIPVPDPGGGHRDHVGPGQGVQAELRRDPSAHRGAQRPPRFRDEELHLWAFGTDGKVTGLRHYLDTAKHLDAARGVDTTR